MSKQKVLFVQLPMPQFMFHKTWGNIPLAAGYLKASALRAGLAETFDIAIVDAKTSSIGGDALLVRKIVEQRPDLLCFTLYYWNGLRSLYIAAQVKRRLPKTRILVGGPEVAADSAYVFDGGIVDAACQGQGEKTFVEILRALRDGKAWKSVAGLIYRDGERLVTNPSASPYTDPRDIPSPYLSRVIDPADYGRAWIETQRGCNFGCKYCTWKIRSPMVFPKERILDELRFIKSRGIRQIKVLNGNFTMSPDFEDLCEGIMAINQDRQLSFVVYVPAELIDAHKARLLKEINCTCANVGLQTVNNDALANVSRKFNPDRFLRGCRNLMEAGATLDIDTIIGLPGDTLRGFHQTIEFIQRHDLNRRPNRLLFFLLSMMPGAPLRDEADKFGIEYDPLPPYYIKGTRTMPPADMAAAVEIAHTVAYVPTAGNKTTRYSMASRRHPDLRRVPVQTSGHGKAGQIHLRTPISMLTARLDHRKQSPEDWKRVASGLRDCIQQPFTAWFTAVDPEKDLEMISAFCHALLKSNPYLIFTLMLEPDGELTPETAAAIKAMMATRERIYQIVTVEKAATLICVRPWNSTRRQMLSPSSRPKHYDLIWSIKIGDGRSGWETAIKSAVDDPRAAGVLLHVADSVPLADRASILQFVSSIYRKTTKSIHFRNLELETTLPAFSHGTSGYRIVRPWHLESVLCLDGEGSVESLFEPNNYTYQDIIAYQPLMQKEAAKRRETQLQSGEDHDCLAVAAIG